VISTEPATDAVNPLDDLWARGYRPRMWRARFLIALGVLTACTTSSGSAPSSTGPASSVSPSPSTSPTRAASSPRAVALPGPGDMVSAFASIWVQSRSEGSVWRIGPTGRVDAKIPDASSAEPSARFGGRSVGLGAGFGSVWSLTDQGLVRIDPTSNKVSGRLQIRSPYALAVGEGAVWIVYGRGQVRLLRVDASTMRAEPFASLGTSVNALGVGDGYVWLVLLSEGGGMERIDPLTGTIHALQVGYNDRFILPTPRWIWLLDSGKAQRIEPSDGSPVDARAKEKATQSIGVAYSDGTVWVNAGTAVGFDATSGKITARIPGFTGMKWWWAGGIAQLGQRVWVADPGGNRILSLPLE
jgi:hypothetical protein